MIESEKVKTKIRMGFGEGKGSYTYGNLLPETSDLEAYITAAAINAVQLDNAILFEKTVESRLVLS